MEQPRPPSGAFPGAGLPTELGLSELRDLLARHDRRAISLVVSAIDTMLATQAGRSDQGAALAGTAVECRRHGRWWQVRLGSRSVLVAHSVGLLHLAALTANPGQEIPAIDLAAGAAAVASDGLASRTDLQCVAQARAERDWPLAELSGASTPGGRILRFPDNAERARVAVGRAIRRAITRVEAADMVIGEHLRDGIRTGLRCSYWPTSYLR